MLRAVAFQNFIYFRDYQFLKLQEGPNIFIGANATGKSASIELIRRCLSRTTNTTTSNVLNKNCPAFTICKFESKTKLSEQVPADSELYSLFVAKHLLEEQQKISYKLVCLKATSVVTSYLDVETANLQDKLQYKLSYEDKDEGSRTIFDKIEDILMSGGNEKAKEFEELLEEIVEHLNGQKTDRETYYSERILKPITDGFVCTFPIRSPAPIQWNKSENFGKKDNYGMTIAKSEILLHLLRNEDVHQDNATNYFQTVTYPLEYTFDKVKEGNTDVIKVVDSQQKDIRLLKIPQGITEAKQFSLILAHKKYRTICLEEPDQGMHPPMVQKMRDLVLRKCSDKTVILTTHNPAMVNHWTMDRVYIFREEKVRDEGIRHEVFKLVDKVGNRYHQEQERLKEILFSSAVLFVEGMTDKKVIEGIFDRVLGNDNHPFIKHDELRQLSQIVSETQIIVLEGAKPYNTWKDIVEKLKIPFGFLLDKDALFDRHPIGCPKGRDRKWRNRSLVCLKLLIKKMENKETGECEKIEEFLAEEIETGKTVREHLSINVKEIVEINVVENFIKYVVLQKKWKEKVKAAYDITLKNEDDYEPFHDKYIHYWKSGNLEDMICSSIMDSKLQKEEKEELFSAIVTCEEDYNEQPNNPKDPIKESLKQMDYGKAKRIADCLWKSKEIIDFLQFLLKKGIF